MSSSENKQTSSGVCIGWNTTQRLKGMNWYTQQYGWILKSCWVKEAKPKKVHTVWFDLYEVQEYARLIYVIPGVEKAGEWLERGTEELSRWCNVLYIDLVGDYTGMYNSQNLLNYTLKVC